MLHLEESHTYTYTYLVLLKHVITVNEALLKGHQVAGQAFQVCVHLLRDLDLVLAQHVELVIEGLQLSLHGGHVPLELLQQVQAAAKVVQGLRGSAKPEEEEEEEEEEVHIHVFIW